MWLWIIAIYLLVGILLALAPTLLGAREGGFTKDVVVNFLIVVAVWPISVVVIVILALSGWLGTLFTGATR
jgi:hypothetical protein